MGGSTRPWSCNSTKSDPGSVISFSRPSTARATSGDCWSSACGTCLSELAALDQLQQTYRPAGLVTLAVSVEDDVLRSARFAADHPARFPLLLDRKKSVSRAYGIERLPTTVLIDRRGRVQAVLKDFRSTDDSYVAQVRALLDDPL